MIKKIAIIGQGVVGKAFKKFVEKHYEIITYDPANDKEYNSIEINSCDLGVVCVPTNSNPDGSCDTSIVENAVKKLETPLILIKSTIEPGTTDRLKKETGKKICFSPEYIGESSYYHPYWIDMAETPFWIVGGDEEDCNEIIEMVEPIMGPVKTYMSCSAIEAELIKYMENSFFATKVTFVNEFYEICKTMGANWHKVRQGWLLDDRVNKMHTTVFKNKRGFSGKCFPKDVKAIVHKSTKSGYKPKLLKQVLSSNDEFLAMNTSTKTST